MQSRSISNIPRIAIALAVSLMLAFMPFTVNLGKYRISLERNEAHAIAPVFVGALAFLEEAAAAAGFATVGEFVATGAGITAVASGLTIGTAAGIQLGDNAGNNLDALIDAADYPAWDTLSSSEQQSWGSSDNYNAAKYNSLMAGFGLGDDYERYKDTWGSFTPGQFQFSSSANDKLDQMGDIGQNWINGAGNAIGDILSNFNRQDIIQATNAYIGPVQYKDFDGTNIEGYPNNAPTHIVVNKGTDFVATKDNRINVVKTSAETFWIYAFDNSATTDRKTIHIYMFSKEGFLFNYASTNSGVMPNVVPSTQAQSRTFDGQTYYVTEYSTQMYTSANYNMVGNGVLSSTAISGVFQAIPYILFNGFNIGDEAMIPNYPEYGITNNDLDNELVYFPSTGINEDTDWNDLIRSAQNTDEDLDSVIALLQHIDSDLHGMDFLDATDLQPLINVLRNIDVNVQQLDFITPDDLDPFMTLLQHIDSDLHKFNFYQTGELKVHDEGVFTELSDIYSLLLEISGKIGNWGDISDAPDIIGDFDFDDIEDKVPNLLETIKELAPFGSVLLLSEMYTILANFAKIQDPVMTFPFDFGGLPGQDTELTIDLSWLDGIKPVINFFCILMFLLAITHATIRIVELEAAS